MTRINLVDPHSLNDKHLMAEIHEITRVFGLVRKLKDRKINKFNFSMRVKQPSTYTLGTGHVTFFYTRLGYVADRYQSLCDEWVKRGKNVQRIDRNVLLEGIDPWYVNGYTPTPEAIEISIERINTRLGEMK